MERLGGSVMKCDSSDRVILWRGHALPRRCQLRYVWVTRGLVQLLLESWARRLYYYYEVNRVDLCSRISIWYVVRQRDRELHMERCGYSAVRTRTAVRRKPGNIRTAVWWKPGHLEQRYGESLDAFMTTLLWILVMRGWSGNTRQACSEGG